MTAPGGRPRIHGDRGSGNCQKVAFLADALGLTYDWVDVDVLAGETRTVAFKALNPMSQIPVIEWPDGRVLAQSNAILRYLADGTRFLPTDTFARAKVDEWLYWEQYSHEPYIAVCRFHMVYLGRSASEREAWRVERGEAALDLMEEALNGRDWLTGEAMSIADISLLAYTRLAGEGGFDLDRRPAVRAWIARSERALGLAPVTRRAA